MFQLERRAYARTSRPCGHWIVRLAICGHRPAPLSGESELGEVEAVLRAHRLVTLTGVGGVGKTRLAVEVAGRLAPEFPDGVWLFELAAVSDPAAVPDAVAAVLGITQQPGRTLTDSVAAALEGRHRLLVFDNCEHLLDPTAEIVEAILEHSATVTVLTTSREGIGVPDEQLWPVPALPVNTGTGSAAVELFVHRARQVAPRFAITHDDEAAAVVEICRRLDGIPLAIELAASRMASMTPARCAIASIGASNFWSDHDGPATPPPFGTQCSGHTTYSMTPKRPCWSGVRCLPAASTSKAPVR